MHSSQNNGHPLNRDQMIDLVASVLAKEGWTPFDAQKHVAVAHRFFETAVGRKEALVFFSRGDGYHYELLGEYISEGSNAVPSILIPVGAEAPTIERLTKQFATRAVARINETYAIRLLSPVDSPSSPDTDPEAEQASEVPAIKVGDRVYLQSEDEQTQSGWYLLHRVRNTSGEIDSPDALVTLCRENNEPGDYINTLASQIHLNKPDSCIYRDVQGVVDHLKALAQKYDFIPDIDSVRDSIEETANLLRIDLSEEEIVLACDVVLGERELPAPVPGTSAGDLGARTTPKGLTAERMRDLLLEDRAKIEPYNSTYSKISMRRPTVNHEEIKDALNRFFSYAIPEFFPPKLVPKSLADDALSLVNQKKKPPSPRM